MQRVTAPTVTAAQQGMCRGRTDQVVVLLRNSGAAQEASDDAEIARIELRRFASVPAGSAVGMVRERQTERADVVEVVVEVPRGCRNKYEQDEEGTLWFDRRLGGPVGFPGDYGFVVGLEGEDGDAMDALVLLDEATFPGVHIECRVVGAFVVKAGERRETKLICVPEHDHHQDHVVDIADLPDNLLQELDAFFYTYRMLESGPVEVLEHQSRAAAVAGLPTAKKQ